MATKFNASIRILEKGRTDYDSITVVAKDEGDAWSKAKREAHKRYPYCKVQVIGLPTKAA